MLSKKIFLFTLIAALFISGSVSAATVSMDKDTGTISEAGSNAVLSFLPTYTGNENQFAQKLELIEGSAKVEDVTMPLPGTIACVQNFEGDPVQTLPEIGVVLKNNSNNEWTLTFSAYDASALDCGGGGGQGPLDPPAAGCQFKCDITVSAVDDDTDEGDTNESFQYKFGVGNSADTESFEIVDNDFAAIIVSDAEYTGPYPYQPFPPLSLKNTSEADPSAGDTFYVELATKPNISGSEKVEVKIQIPDAFADEVSFKDDNSQQKELKLEFFENNWNVGQLVTVYGLDDAPENPSDGPQQGNLTVKIENDVDPEYPKFLAGPQVTVENADNDVPGKVRIKSGSTILVENETASNNEVQVTLERVDGSSGPISVNYTITNGVTNPTKDGDYQDNSGGTVAWTNGDDADKTILIDIVDDAWMEASETFTVTISDVSANPEDQVTVDPKVSDVTINSNDDIDFSVASASELEGGAGDTTPVLLTVTRTGGIVEDGGDPIVLGCMTSPGAVNPATPGSDYVSACTGFSFGHNDPNPTLSVDIKG